MKVTLANCANLYFVSLFAAQWVAAFYRGGSLYLFEFLANHGEGFEDLVSGAGHCHYSLWTGRVGDVDFGTALQARERTW